MKGVLLPVVTDGPVEQHTGEEDDLDKADKEACHGEACKASDDCFRCRDDAPNGHG